MKRSLTRIDTRYILKVDDTKFRFVLTRGPCSSAENAGDSMQLHGLPFGSSFSLILRRPWTFCALRREIGWKL